ncbi:Uncharacterized protein Adt_01520 [Abeliophyllum distichum]|uniref:Uncharacterized protein n=1 Tax=Abeliophyllum distichum TaxID=126358 RepID=A0ABD1VTA0_9LAMI
MIEKISREVAREEIERLGNGNTPEGEAHLVKKQKGVAQDRPRPPLKKIAGSGPTTGKAVALEWKASSTGKRKVIEIVEDVVQCALLRLQRTLSVMPTGAMVLDDSPTRSQATRARQEETSDTRDSKRKLRETSEPLGEAF